MWHIHVATYSTVHHYLYMRNQGMIRLCYVLVIFLIRYLTLDKRASCSICC